MYISIWTRRSCTQRVVAVYHKRNVFHGGRFFHDLGNAITLKMHYIGFYENQKDALCMSVATIWQIA